MKKPFKNCYLFSLVVLPLLGVITIYGQESVKLSYKFRQGERLQYKTERHDFTTMDMGGQKNTMKVTTWSINSLTVENTPPGRLYEIISKQDTSWNDMDNNGTIFSTGSSQGGYTTGSTNISIQRGSTRRAGISIDGNTENKIEMNDYGKTGKDKPIVSDFIILLPEKPINVNESWSFNYKVKQEGRAKGETVVKGKCILYAVEKKGSSTIATIIVNSETTSQTEINLKMNDQSFSLNSSSAGSGMSLIYFDIDKGRIIEIVKESTKEMTTDSPMGGGGVNTITSKATIKLQ